MTDVVHVAVGVIYRQQQIFLTRRAADVHQGGKWEFPGGKVEAQESVQQALTRELREEVAIEVQACQPLIVIEHDYGDKQVCLEVFMVDDFQHEPCAQEGQQQAWVHVNQLNDLDFPAANKAIIDALHDVLALNGMN